MSLLQCSIFLCGFSVCSSAKISFLQCISAGTLGDSDKYYVFNEYCAERRKTILIILTPNSAAFTDFPQE